MANCVEYRGFNIGDHESKLDWVRTPYNDWGRKTPWIRIGTPAASNGLIYFGEGGLYMAFFFGGSEPLVARVLPCFFSAVLGLFVLKKRDMHCRGVWFITRATETHSRYRVSIGSLVERPEIRLLAYTSLFWLGEKGVLEFSHFSYDSLDSERLGYTRLFNDL